MSKIITTIYIVIASLGLIMLKFGTSHESAHNILTDKLPINLNAYTISGIAFYGISFLLYIYLLSKYDLGYIIPLVTGCMYILIFVASYFIFKESFTATKIIAILLILGGVVILNLNK